MTKLTRVTCAVCGKRFRRYKSQLRNRNYCSQDCFRSGRLIEQPNRIRSSQLKDGEHISTTIYLTKETLAKLEALEDYYQSRNRSYVAELLINQKYEVIQNKQVEVQIGDRAA